MSTIHNLAQGSAEWLEFRFQHDGASEAAAMLGLSKLTTRTELLRLKKTGAAKEFSAFVQERVLDKGHKVEAAARPLLVEQLGEDLYPVTLSIGRLSASCDGLTLDEKIAFEHKQFNAALAALVAAGTVPDEHMPQCQQVLMVTKAAKLIFVVSDGTPDRWVQCEVLPDPAWFERIAAGWEQFHRDLADFVPVDTPTAPMGKSMETLPALMVQVRGEVTASNLNEFKEYAVAVITSINRELNTDQDFADAGKAIKWCLDVKEKMVGVKAHTLAQTQTIEQVFTTIDSIVATADEVRLDLEKLVTRRNKEKKDGMIIAGQQAFTLHLTSLEHELRPLRLSTFSMPNFADAIKGKRSYALMQDAIDSLLANTKISADAMAKDFRAKTAWLATVNAGYENLFADMQQLVAKPMEDFQMVANSRITAAKTAEATRLEAQREAIRKEEQALAAAAVAASAAAVPAPIPEPAAEVIAAPAPAPAPAPAAAPATVHAFPVAAAKVAAPSAAPTLKLGTLNVRIAPIQITAEGLRELGFEGTKERGACLYHEADFAHILAALVRHLEAINAQQAA